MNKTGQSLSPQSTALCRDKLLSVK